MTLVKILGNGEVCIIEDGKTHLFDRRGICTKDDAGNLSFYMDFALDLPVLSLLTTGTSFDIGLTYKGKFKRFESSLKSMECAMKLQLYGKFLRMLKRTGSEKDIVYNQLLFVYPENVDMVGILNCIGAKEV